MRLLFACLLALFTVASAPVAFAQRAAIDFDIFDKSDFEAQLKSGKPVIVHVNTTW
jgi:hypothetical protein